MKQLEKTVECLSELFSKCKLHSKGSSLVLQRKNGLRGSGNIYERGVSYFPNLTLLPPLEAFMFFTSPILVCVVI